MDRPKPRTTRAPATSRAKSAKRIPGGTAPSKPLTAHAARRKLEAKLVEIVQRFIPDFDFATLAPDANLRQALAADSLDMLNLVTAIHEELGIDIPEADYTKIDTLDHCLDYLTARQAAAASA